MHTPLWLTLASVTCLAVGATPSPAADTVPLCPAWAPAHADTQGLTSAERAAAAGTRVDRHAAVFGELTPGEYGAVHAFLVGHPDLNLVDTGTPAWQNQLNGAFAAVGAAWHDAGSVAAALAAAADVVATSYVHAVWREAPRKADAVAYLDGCGDGGAPPSLPPRKARAMLVLAGDADAPRVEEVLVTIDAAAVDDKNKVDRTLGGRRTIAGVETVGTRRPPRVHSLERVPVEGTRGMVAALPLAYRPIGFADVLGVHTALAKVAPALNAFLEAAFGGRRLCGEPVDGDGCRSCVFVAYCYNYQIRNATASVGDRTPHQLHVRTLETILGVRNEGAGCAVVEQQQNMVLPLEFLAESGHSDSTNWTATGWWYRDRFYSTVADMAADVTAAQSAPVTDTTPPAHDFVAPRPGPKRGANQPVGPLPHEPYGRRFTLSAAPVSPRVEWLGWEVTIGYKATSGPRFWDVRFKGERIAYELALQEISCDFGYLLDPTMSDSLFLDSAWGIGASFRELAHGRDCPLNAAFVDTHSMWGGEGVARTHPNSVCVFERDPGLPAAKHYDSLYGYYQAVRGGELVIRFSSEGFYEHVVDLVLSVDGTLRMDVHKVGVGVLGPVLPSAGAQAPPSARGRVPRTFFEPRVDLDAFAGRDAAHALAAAAPYFTAATFRVDLDVGAARGAGANNSVFMHRAAYVRPPPSPGGGFGTGRPVPTYTVDVAHAASDSLVAAHAAAGVVPVVVCEGETARGAAAGNAPRGYAVHVHGAGSLAPPILSAADAASAAGLPLGGALAFQRWQFAATRRREDEPSASVPYLNAWYGDPRAADWGLAGYVQGVAGSRNDDGSRQDGPTTMRHADVVAWVSSAAVAMPSLEWEPAYPTAATPVLGFKLVPFNWAAEHPATDMADAVVVTVADPDARGVPGQRGRPVGRDQPVDRVARLVEEATVACRPRGERVPFLEGGFEA